MKLTKKEMLLISFMLFSLFFGAGNLIFPPFLGQNAADHTGIAFLGFLLTAVLLPVLGVIVVAQFDGLNNLASRVNSKFAIVFTIIVYLAIGPGLGIPRAASVPFEMAISPYLPEGFSFGISMLIYSALFFATACWLALTPRKLVSRIGKFLTPSLLTLLVFLFINFVLNGQKVIGEALPVYVNSGLAQGFIDGYQTMDTIAALNFGLVIAITLRGFKLKEKKDIMKYTVLAGLAAGTILSLVYMMLAFIGMQTAGVAGVQANGALILRYVVYELFGNGGAILLALIFTLACLTTCVGLINSISQFFTTIFRGLNYRQWVFVIVISSFLICNLGLNTILSISLPVLDMVYPVSIVLIVLGLFDKYLKDNRFIYPLVIFTVAITSIVYALFRLKVPMGPVYAIFKSLPFFETGMAWVSVAIVSILIALVLNKLGKKA